MKRGILAVAFMVVMGSQPVYADDSLKHTAKTVVLKSVKLLHVGVHLVEKGAHILMAPVHWTLNALGEPLEE